MPPLKCIAIILCESAYRVEGGMNLVIANTFHGMSSARFPFRCRKFTVVYTLTEGHGTYNMELSIVNARTGQGVTVFKRPFTQIDPLALGDVVVSREGVTFHAPGKYIVELRYDGELISQRPFYVVLDENLRMADIEKGE